MTHELEAKLSAKGMDKHLLRQDLYAAINRMAVSHDGTEFKALTRDQLLMYLIISNADRDSNLWELVEEQLGERL